MALLGTEVKSIRAGSVNLRDSYARIDRGEVVAPERPHRPVQPHGLCDPRGSPSAQAAAARHEIRKLTGQVAERGLTLVPLQMYFKNGRVKVALALVKGKQVHDKRETIRRREVDRETRAAVKARQR